MSDVMERYICQILCDHCEHNHNWSHDNPQADYIDFYDCGLTYYCVEAVVEFESKSAAELAIRLMAANSMAVPNRLWVSVARVYRFELFDTLLFHDIPITMVRNIESYTFIGGKKQNKLPVWEQVTDADLLGHMGEESMIDGPLLGQAIAVVGEEWPERAVIQWQLDEDGEEPFQEWKDDEFVEMGGIT